MSRIAVDGCELYYEDSGSGRGLLFVHGWGTSSRVWNNQELEFATDHRVLAVDLRGCGRSDHPDSGNTIAQFAMDLVEVVDQLRLEDPIVIGSSIGGAVAVELGLRAQDRLGGIVVVDAPGHWAAKNVDKLMRLQEGLRARRAATLAEWVPNWFGPHATHEIVEGVIEQILESGTYIDELLAELATYDPRPRLPDLRVPTTFLHGELDAEVPVHVGKASAELVHDAELTIIKEAGHMVQLERPEAFNAALRTSIARMVASKAA